MAMHKKILILSSPPPQKKQFENDTRNFCNIYVKRATCIFKRSRQAEQVRR